MRLIDANELIKDRVENDPVVIAVKNEPTVDMKENEVKFPLEPIECAAMLINAGFEYENNSLLVALGADKTSYAKYYSPAELRQIAEHLLVYCNNLESEND